MQETALEKKQLRAVSRIPFLADFPYPEFTFQHHVMQNRTISDAVVGVPVDSIIFQHKDFPDPMINILESQIWHFYDIRNNVSKVNQISEQVSKALETNSLLEKRSAIQAAEKWFNDIEGKSFQISAGTFSDILASYVGKNWRDEIEQISTMLTKLDDGKSIVIMNREQRESIVKYFNFQLVYFKLLIGIILAAKIAL